MFRICAFIVVISSTLIAQDFRGSTWGDSAELVKRVEKRKPELEEKNRIVYPDTISGLNCFAIFHFLDNQLVQGGYVFYEKHSNNNIYITDFNKLKEALVDKYGKPNDDDTIWRKDKSYYQRNPDKIGNGVAVGDVYIYSLWKGEETNILLQLTGDNYKPSLLIRYESNEYQKLIEEAQKKENASKL